MFLSKTYLLALFEVKLQFVKVPCPYFNVDCSTLQTSKPNHPTTCIHKHTHKQQVSHTCMHSFIHSIHHIHSITLSRTNQASPLQFITIYNYPSIINHALHGPLSTFVHARIVAMTRTQWNAIACIPLQPPLTEIHTYMHACIEMTTSSHPLNVLVTSLVVVVVVMVILTTE